MLPSHPISRQLLSPKEGYLGSRLRQRRLLGKVAGSVAAAGGVCGAAELTAIGLLHQEHTCLWCPIVTFFNENS